MNVHRFRLELKRTCGFPLTVGRIDQQAHQVRMKCGLDTEVDSTDKYTEWK